MNNFDAFLMVDWSAKKSPCKGADSVWFCLLQKNGTMKLENPNTRQQAFSAIEIELQSLVKEQRRCLIGFDFPFGYPSGFAKALQFSGTPWLETWKHLFSRMNDQPNNANNRFAIAAEMNQRISQGPGPFWGCPTTEVCACLTRTKPEIFLSEYRFTERKIRGPQSAYKLYGIGSVGSQALMGIPYLYKLRFQNSVSEKVRVWPFETDFRLTSDHKITLAEVYPSWLSDCGTGHPIKDARQVKTLCEKFLQLDSAGDLDRFFAPTLLPGDRNAVLREEGWILGIL